MQSIHALPILNVGWSKPSSRNGGRSKRGHIRHLAAKLFNVQAWRCQGTGEFTDRISDMDLEYNL